MNKIKQLIFLAGIYSAVYAFSFSGTVTAQNNSIADTLQQFSTEIKEENTDSTVEVLEEKIQTPVLDSSRTEQLPANTIIDSSMIAFPPSKDLTPVPDVRSEKDKSLNLPPGPPFFEIQNNIEQLEERMDSLVKIIEVYKKMGNTPTINKELLKLITIPEFQHRIQLVNGTIVVGEILERNELKILVQTSIGQLSIDRDKVELITDIQPAQALVEFVGDPVVNIYPDREEINGRVKNLGDNRADFVRIIVKLWSPDTNLAASDSVFISGSKRKYKTGIVSNTMLKPGSMGVFNIVIPLNTPGKVEYRTYEILWEETD